MDEGLPSSRCLNVLSYFVDSVDNYENSMAPQTRKIPQPSSRWLNLPEICVSIGSDLESNVLETPTILERQPQSRRWSLPESFSSVATGSEYVKSTTKILERPPSSQHLSSLDSLSHLDPPKRLRRSHGA